jgi:transposase
MVTEKQQAILQQIARSATSTVQHARRARIILEAVQGKFNGDISTIVGLDRVQIGLWRRRWGDSSAALVAIECRETNAELTRAIQQILSDAPRSGSPGTFTAEQVTQILAVACELPENSGRPINRWTHRELRDEVIQRGIVSSISKSQVGSYLKQADLQPHRSKYWLNTKEKCQETFDQQVQLVCQTYLEAPGLFFQAQTHTVSVDEMPGVQAIERIAKKIPMQPGKPERIEYEYIRHGTVCLIGNWDVVTGQMIAPTIAPRTEEDLVAHSRTVQTDPRQAGCL